MNLWKRKLDHPFVNSVDQDQAAQSVQTDRGSTLSDMEIYFSDEISSALLEGLIMA